MTFSMSHEGILLRRTPYGDNDLILFFLTESGTETFFARAAQRSRKRFSGQLDFFRRLKLNTQRKGQSQWATLESCDLLEVWEPLWQNSERYWVASHWIDLLRRLLPPGKGGSLYPFVCESLRYLASEAVTTAILPELDVRFALRLSRLLGYGPNFEHCLDCQTPPAGKAYFAGEWGRLLCGSCQASRQSVPSILPLSSSTVSWLVHYQQTGKSLTALSSEGVCQLKSLLGLHWRQVGLENKS